VLARKTELPGPVAQQLQRSMESELAGMTSSGRIADLEGQVAALEQRVAELARQVDRFRSQPLIRAALAARRALRRSRP